MVAFTKKISCSYTLYQNGVVERKNKYVVEICLTLLIRLRLYISHWEYTFFCVVHVITKCLHEHFLPSRLMNCCIIKNLLMTTLEFLDASAIPLSNPITQTNFNQYLFLMFSLVFLHITKAIGVCTLSICMSI